MRLTGEMNVLRRGPVLKRISMRDIRGQCYHKLSNNTRNWSAVCGLNVPVPSQAAVLYLQGAPVRHQTAS